FLGWVSTPLEMVLRSGFGERYLSPARIVLGLGATWVILGLTNLAFLFSGNLYAPYNPYDPYAGAPAQMPPANTAATLASCALLVGCVMAAVILRVMIWRRNRQGVLWHTFCFGISHLERLGLPISDWLLYAWVEPLLAFGLGFLLRHTLPPVGTW